MKPIARGDQGPAVEDVQRRLLSLGYDLGSTRIDGRFSDLTAAAVAAFRSDEGLPAGETVDDACWAALVDATFQLGDRTLFLKMPYFHGRDVREMQIALNVLGFGAMQVDGIFGAQTEQAVRDFQLNVGIAPDGIAGSLTFNAIDRLRQVWEGKDATPHSGSRTGFSRAAEVLEGSEVCFWGADPTLRDIANRIANLALATTAQSRVTSADTRQGLPGAGDLLIELTFAGAPSGEGIPFVSFTDDSQVLATRLDTAVKAASAAPRRICIGLPPSADALTVRQRQHYTVAVLDALCTALA